MSLSKEEAIEKARRDFANRMGVKESEIATESVEETDFPDLALGAGAKGEMSGQMITPGWRIRLKGAGKSLEYRANKNQVRLFNHKGANHRI